MGYHKTLSDDEGFDRIEIEQVPRFKTSDMSGDEWRTSAVTRFYRKGKLVSEVSTGRMEVAAAQLGHFFFTLPETCPEPLYLVCEEVCNQPSCGAPAVVTYRLKEEFSRQGEGPLPQGSEASRSFCEAHMERGDASREDSMQNYERHLGQEVAG